MFAKPTARKKTGRKSHDRCPAKPEKLDLSTVPALRRALQLANLAVIAKMAGCKTSHITAFVNGKQSNLPSGVQNRVSGATREWYEAGSPDQAPAP